MSQAEIRAPAEQERERVAEVLATSLNFPRARAVARSHLYELDDMRVAVSGDDIVATAGEFSFEQWLTGRALACSAIWGVATLPEHRGWGLASAAVLRPRSVVSLLLLMPESR